VWSSLILLFFIIQEPPPLPSATPGISYPIQPVTNTLGLVVGAVVIVLVVIGGILYAEISRRNN
jgi:hypothetical protein